MGESDVCPFGVYGLHVCCGGSALCCSMLLCAAVYSVLQCVAVCCSVLQCMRLMFVSEVCQCAGV